MILNRLSQQQMKSRIEGSVLNERKSIRQVVEDIAEVDRRRLYLEWGFASLFEFLTRHLKYSEAAAYRRIQAARALRQVPELRQELEDGRLNLSQIAQAQTAFKQEEKISGLLVTSEMRKQVFNEIRAKTKVETEKILDAKLPRAAKVAPTQEKHKSDDSVVLTVRLPSHLAKKLERVKQLYSHSIPNGNWIEVLEKMADDVVAKRDPLVPRKKTAPKPISTQSFAAAEVAPPKNIPSPIRRFIFQRDQKCQYRKPDGSVCGSRYQLEIDHIQPRFAGGGHDLRNLRLLCRQHNQFRYSKGTGISLGPPLES